MKNGVYVVSKGNFLNVERLTLRASRYIGATFTFIPPTKLWLKTVLTN